MITINEPGILTQAADFDNPLGLIKACHERISFHCDLLDKIMAYLVENEVDKELVDTARKVHRYFSTAGKLHHQDEEQDIFPRLVNASMKLADIINNLKQEHQEMDKLWETIGAALDKPRAILQEQLPKLREACDSFCKLNRKHIAFEEENILSIATHLLSNEELKIIGNAMKNRRNL